MAEAQTNPYVGPRTFEERDARHFFGRDREGRDLLSLIISDPLVLFFAESGAGKSSLLNAKIIPGLRHEGYFVYPVVRVGGELPAGLGEVGNIYAYNLLASLAKGDAGQAALAQTSLLEAMAARKGDLPDPEIPRVLIIDQFEEILTTHPQHWEDREAFFEQLGQLVREDRLLWVVLTMREDYVGALDPFISYLPGKLRARFYMQRMEPPAAIEAIQQPAAQAGRPFAAGVAAQLVDNLRQIRTGPDQTVPGQYVEPVQLQVVCYQLWENLRGSDKKEISAEDVEKLGNVDEALAEFYETALGEVMAGSGVSEMSLRNWFDRNLITEASTRGTVYQGTGDTAGMPNEVVAMLERKFLLRAEIRAGGTWFELIHDRFIAPIQRANQLWRLTQSPLLRAAEEWDRGGRNPNLLYRDELLKSALTATNRETAEPLLEEFLTASEQAQSQRDLVLVQKEKEEQTRRAEAEAKIASRLRWLAVALTFFVIAAGVAAYFAVTLANRAFDESAVAQAAQAAAEAKVTEAIVMQTTVEAGSTLAVEQQSTAVAAADAAGTRSVELQTTADAAGALAAEAGALAAQAQATASSADQAAAEAQAAYEATRASINMLRQSIQGQLLIAQIPELLDQTNDPELALLFGVQAYRLNQILGRTDEDILIYQSLRETLARPVFNTSLLQADTTGALVALPGSRVLISGQNNGVLRVWNLADPGAPPLDFDSGSGAVTALTANPAGDFIVSGHQTGQIVIWEVTRGAEGVVRDLTPLQTLTGHENGVLALTFTADGRELASGGEDVTLRFWDVSDPAGEVTLINATADAVAQTFHNGPIFSIAYLPNGQVLSASQNRIILWNRFSETPTFEKFLTTSRGFQGRMVLTSDAAYLAVGVDGAGFFVYRVQDIRTSASPLPIPLQNSITNQTARALAFQPGTRPPLLAVYSSNRRLNTYEVFSNQVSAARLTLAGANEPVRALAFLPGAALASGGDGESLRLWQLNYTNPAAGLPQDLENLGEVIELACAQVQRNMTQGEWDEYIPGEGYQATCPNWPPHFTTGAQP